MSTGSLRYLACSIVLILAAQVLLLGFGNAQSPFNSALAISSGHDGVVSVDKASVKNGDTLTITVNDPDLNTDSQIAEQASVTLHTRDDTISTPDVTISNLVETGADTGIFSKTIQIGKDVRISDLTTNRFATILEVHYLDQLASDLSVNVDREIDVTVTTATGSIAITPSVVGANTRLIILVNDTDLNSNPGAIDSTLVFQPYLFISSNATFANVISTGTQGVETGPSTGIFNTTLLLSPAANQFSDGRFTTSGNVINGTALPGDVITIKYFDQKNATGGTSTQTLFVPVDSILSTSSPTLRIVNNIIGGPATPDNFSLSLNGNPIANNTLVPLQAGQSQFVDLDYLPANLSNSFDTTFAGNCDQGGEIIFGKVVPGTNLECAITNKFIPYNSTSLISTDRAIIPNPASGGAPVSFNITIRDSGLDQNPNALDSPIIGPASPSDSNNLQLSITNPTGFAIFPSIDGLTSGPGILAPQQFTETGSHTGIFSSKFFIFSSDSPFELDGATMKFTYTATNGTSFSASVKIRSYDAAISASKLSVKNGDILTVTVKDRDLNRDNSIAENTTIQLHTSKDTIQVPDTVISDLHETGADTGVFTKTIQIGRDVKVSDLSSNKFATVLEIHYNDRLASDLSVQVDRELDLKVATTTGTITNSPSTINPSSKLAILVNDTDLNANQQLVDTTSSSSSYLRITSNAANANILEFGIMGVETGPATGVFNTTLLLSQAANQSIDGKFTGTGNVIDGTALPGDILSIQYFDQKNSTGGASTTTLFVPISGSNSNSTATVTVMKHIVGGPATLANLTFQVDGFPVDNGTSTEVIAGRQQNVTEFFNPFSLANQYNATFGDDCTSGIIDNIKTGIIPANKVIAGSNLVCTITNIFTPHDYTISTSSIPNGITPAPVQIPFDQVTIMGINGTMGQFDANGTLTGPSGNLQSIHAGTTADTFPVVFNVLLNTELTEPGSYCWDISIVDISGNYNTTVHNLNGTDDNNECFTIQQPTVPPTVTVIKHIDGGSATLDNFTLLLNGQQVSNGTTTNVTIGMQQNVSEVSLPNYVASFSGDCDSNGVIDSGKVVDGANLICIITNTFTQPTESPADSIQNLIALEESMHFDKGTSASFDAKLNAAYDSVTRGNLGAAENQLNAFIHAVSALEGRNLTHSQAEQLTSAAQDIIGMIEG